MIDIHIITTPGNEQAAEAQCARLSHPLVNIVRAPYVHGNILEARFQGFSQGVAPYVSWVDDDDTILDLSWVEEAHAILDRDPTVSAVYPRWKATQDGSHRYTTSGDKFDVRRFMAAPALIDAHHLTVMRRANVVPMLQAMRAAHPKMMNSTERTLVIGQLRYGTFHPLPQLAYEWKLRPNSARTVNDPPAAQAFTRDHVMASLAFQKQRDTEAFCARQFQ